MSPLQAAEQQEAPPRVRILPREERTDWAGIIKWICAAIIAIAVVVVVVSIGLLGWRLFTGFSNAMVGVGSVGTQLVAFLGQAPPPAATTTLRIPRPIQPYKVPLVKRRTIDPAVPILKEMFLHNSVQLGERRLAYMASLTDTDHDRKLDELARNMGLSAYHLTETERLVTSGFVGLHVNVTDEFHQLWGIETRLQVWEAGLPATIANNEQIRPPTLPGDELAKLRSTLKDITDDFGNLLLGSERNRSKLLSDLSEGLGGAKIVSIVHSNQVRADSDSESAKLPKRADLVHKDQADKAEAEAERRRRWWRRQRSSSRSANSNTESPEGRDVADAAILDQASNAMADLALTMNVAVSVMGRVCITLTLERHVVRGELEELRQLGDRVRKHANMMAKNPNPQLHWLQIVAQQTMDFVQDAWDILARYQAHEVTDVAIR